MSIRVKGAENKCMCKNFNYYTITETFLYKTSIAITIYFWFIYEYISYLLVNKIFNITYCIFTLPEM